MPESSCLLAIGALLPPLRAGAEDGGPGRRKPVQHQAHRRKTDTEPVGQLALAAQPSAAKELAETLPSSPPGYPAAAKSGIRVNAVAPGPTDTGMLTRFTGTPESKAALVAEVPMSRLGLPDELANAIVFIASAEDDLEEGAR